MKKHPDIGKRVMWQESGETGYGILLAVDCDDTSIPHLVQRDDGLGWILDENDSELWHKKARKQGVKDGTENLYWVSKYKVVGKHKHSYVCCECGEKK